MRFLLVSIICVLASCGSLSVAPTPSPTGPASASLGTSAGTSLTPLPLVGPCAAPTLSPRVVVNEFFRLLDQARLPEMATCWAGAADRIALMREYASTGGTTARLIGSETPTANGTVAVEVRVDWRNRDGFGAWESGQTKWLILGRQQDGRWAIESTATALIPSAP